ncbi:MAG: glycosyltransferase family 4 protein [Anaerolineae bacterium]|nr:glycosyltransferase family 4 protein [Anaerolineae bacterium]
MRVLFISAFYPPQVVGGWEQLVHDINERLKNRGHITHVLTSTYGVDEPKREEGVDRLLTLESDLNHYQPTQFVGHKRRLAENLENTRQTIENFKPDVIFIHVMFNLSRGIAYTAEQLCPGRVVYYVANDWPHALDPHTAYWRDPAKNPILNIAKQMLSPIPLNIVERENNSFQLKFERVLCVSQAIKNTLAREADIPLENMSVVYNGVETDLFVPAEKQNNKSNNQDSLSLFYAGSLNTHKGVHTAIEAMAILTKQSKAKGISLTIVGSGHPDYETRLKTLVKENNLENVVHFPGRVPREDMPALLQKHDVLIFPSIWEEPLARMTQEAMAAGMAVISTLTGGTGELVIEGETGLTFDPEDATTLAQRIEQLKNDPELHKKLVKNGREKVLQQFDIRRMIDEIEIHLSDVVNQTSTVRLN